jgi:hypothetical protein
MCRPELNNLATRLLCDVSAPMGELPDDALEDAKANLRDFEFVGLRERFDESVVLLQRTLGLGLIPYEHRHASAARPAVEEISEAERALIEEHNLLDAELYRFGIGLFTETIADVDEGFDADVETLRRLSADATEEARRELEAARDWLERELPVGTTKPVAELRVAARAAGIPETSFKRALKARSREGTLEVE